MSDFLRQDYDPPTGADDPGYWTVHLAIDPVDRDALLRAVPHVMPVERVRVYVDVEKDGDGDGVVALSVFASSSDEAVEEATHKYRKIREGAELPVGDDLVLGYLSPWWDNTARRVGQEALELLRQDRCELAVVRVQTGCELHVAEALSALLRDRHPHADADALIRRPATLRDKHSKALLELLTGHRVQDQEWWPNYVDHLKRRNAIVHEGLSITHADAQASIDVVLDLRGWLLDIRGVPDLDDEDLADTL
jgi:hypothetical protein